MTQVTTPEVRYVISRGDTYISLTDILDTLDTLSAGAIEAGRDPYLLTVLRHTLCEGYARAK